MKLPEIHEQDIDEATTQWAWPKPLDPDRREILRSMDRVDIRACPGSGKTSLLVMKLGLLASKWTYKHRGICVLSHTNVAREEVEKKLGKIRSLQALTRYPHYIGTIQTFLHTFLANPGAFERFGVRPSVVDNQQYEIEAKQEWSQGTKRNGRYSTANNFLRNLIHKNAEYNTVGDYISRHIEYLDRDLSLPALGSAGWDSKSGREVQEFKQRMSQMGLFRYQDMAAIAAWYLHRHPGISRLLQERFPLVFFDETQDTVFQQAQLFDIIFPENCLVQRFGDDRQAIYHSTLADEEGAHFPRGKQSQMQESFRLSPSIAHLSETVCADNPPESLQGDKQKPDRRHTVFVFKRTSIQKVLTAFCDLVSSEIGPGLDPNEIQAVGANTKPKSELKKFPSAITDYWPDFVPKNEQIKARLASLPAYLDELRKEIRTTQSTVSARQLLLQSCARILRLQGVLDNGRRLTPSAMMDKLKNQDPENYHKLNSFLARTCQKILSVNEPTAQAVADELRPLLALFNAQAWNHEVRQFILQTSGASSPKNRKSTPEENVFVRTNAGDTVSVKVDTIHSVKGKTLTAVLVLETVYFEHDLQVLTKKGYLTGRPPSVAPAKRLLGHLKRIYVAMTRPTDLLCLAILDEHLSDGDRDLLLKRGWAIKEV